MVNESLHGNTIMPSQLDFSGDILPYDQRPFIRIIEQPSSSHRFRYGSEKGSHGCLKGQSNAKKSFPIIKLENFDMAGRRVFARASLYTVGTRPEPHINMLTGKTCRDGMSEVEFNCADGTAKFQDLGIEHFKKCEAISLLANKLAASHCAAPSTAESRNKLNAEAKEKVDKMRLDVVQIRFDAFCRDGNGREIPVCDPVFSEAIYHSNSNKCGTLKIVNIDKLTGHAKGGDTIFLLCEKIDKKNIKIRMYERDENGSIVWEGYGQFTDNNVHHNVAIVFTTPPYKDKNITKAVNVTLELFRPSDERSSNPKTFWYLADDSDEEQISRKRKKPCPLQSSSSMDDYSSSVSSPEMPTTSSVSSPEMTGSMCSPERPTPSYSPVCPPSQAIQHAGSTSYDTSQLEDGMFCGEIPGDGNINFLFDMTDDKIQELAAQLDTPINTNEFSMPSGDSSVEQFPSRFDPIDELYNNIQSEGAPRPFIENQSLSGMYLQTDSVVNRNADKAGSMDEFSNMFSKSLSLVETTETPASEPSSAACTSDEKMRKYIQKVQKCLIAEDKNGNNLLHVMILHHKEKVSCLKVFYLACQGLLSTVVNHCNKMHQTPLHVAVIENSLDILEFLLKCHADFNAIDRGGNSVVHLSAEYDRPECLTKILRYSSASRGGSVDVNKANFEGCRPLHYAIKANSLSCLVILLQAGARVSETEEKTGRTSLHLAVLHAPHFLELLVSQAVSQEVNLCDHAGYTALHLACMQKCHDAVCVLVKAGADPSLLVQCIDDSCDENDEWKERTAMDLAEGDEVILGILTEALKLTSSQISDGQGGTSSHIVASNRTYNPSVQHDVATPKQFIPEAVMKKLQKLYDPPSTGWEALATVFFDEAVAKNIGKLEKGHSPIKAIINHLLKTEFSLNNEQQSIEMLKNAFESVGLEEGRHVLEQLETTT